jgi:hypothetical protein
MKALYQLKTRDGNRSEIREHFAEHSHEVLTLLPPTSFGYLRSELANDELPYAPVETRSYRLKDVVTVKLFLYEEVS